MSYAAVQRIYALSRSGAKSSHEGEILVGALRAVVPIVCAMFIIGCAHTGAGHRRLQWTGYHPITDYRSNTDTDRVGRLGGTRIVTASWYGPGYEDKRTASGERFDSNRFTAASTTLPLDSIV